MFSVSLLLALAASAFAFSAGSPQCEVPMDSTSLISSMNQGNGDGGSIPLTASIAAPAPGESVTLTIGAQHGFQGYFAAAGAPGAPVGMITAEGGKVPSGCNSGVTDAKSVVTHSAKLDAAKEVQITFVVPADAVIGSTIPVRVFALRCMATPCMRGSGQEFVLGTVDLKVAAAATGSAGTTKAAAGETTTKAAAGETTTKAAAGTTSTKAGTPAAGTNAPAADSANVMTIPLLATLALAPLFN